MTKDEIITLLTLTGFEYYEPTGTIYKPSDRHATLEEAKLLVELLRKHNIDYTWRTRQ